MLSKEEVEKIAKLARLELTDEEIVKMRKDLSGILEHFKSLQKIKEKPEIELLAERGLDTRKTTRPDMAIQQEEPTNKIITGSFPDKKGTHNKVKSIF